MKKLICVFLFCFSFLIHAEDDKNSVIVAVGEAELMKQKIYFMSTKIIGDLNKTEKEAISTLDTILKDDFGFYQHWFEVESAANTDIVDYASWEKKGAHFIFTSYAQIKEDRLTLSYKVYDIFKKQTLIEESSDVWVSKIREYSHIVADKVYRSIKNKDSIFTKKIVFVSDRTSRGTDTKKELYIMDFDGHQKLRLTHHNSMVISPSVSPDNRKVLYSLIEDKWAKSSQGRMHKIKNVNLYEMTLNNRKYNLVSQISGINSGAIYTEDPNHILLTLTYTKNADIYRMNLQTKKVRRITSHYSDDVDPALNADGSIMTFLSARSGRAMIYTLDPHAVEKDVKRISFVGRFNASPRFSPDGKEIVFSSWVDNLFDIYKINADGKGLVRLTKNFGSNEEASFSSDGEFIIFTSQRVLSQSKAVQDVYIMNKEGEIIKKLTENYGKCLTPRWFN